MKKILLAMSLIAIAVNTSAQSNGVPSGYKLVAAADYAPYEQNVIKSIDWWLAVTPDSKSDEQKEAQAFLLKWIGGSPDIMVDIHPEIVNFFERNNDLLLVFMLGWTKYALQSRKFDDKVNGNVEGIKAVNAYYLKHKASLKRDEHVEAYIKMQKEQTLVDFVKKQVKS